LHIFVLVLLVFLHFLTMSICLQLQCVHLVLHSGCITHRFALHIIFSSFVARCDFLIIISRVRQFRRAMNLRQDSFTDKTQSFVVVECGGGSVTGRSPVKGSRKSSNQQRVIRHTIRPAVRPEGRYGIAAGPTRTPIRQSGARMSASVALGTRPAWQREPGKDVS